MVMLMLMLMRKLMLSMYEDREIYHGEDNNLQHYGQDDGAADDYGDDAEKEEKDKDGHDNDMTRTSQLGWVK
eukprot:5223212-Karenia_brevis.AAC.1